MRDRRLPVALVLATVVGACTPSPAPGDAGALQETTTTSAGTFGSSVDEGFAGSIRAPEFPTGLDWLNTDAPLSMEALRGKIVLLDFWTYGCINCIHIIPDLKRLEAEYPDELVVIGVHSAKFTNESATENIQQVVVRYGLGHPVVNDEDFAIWSSWGAQAWPTVALVDPLGFVVGTHSGEGVYQVVKPVLDDIITEFGTEIDRTPIALDLEADGAASTVLSFPGKVLADPASDRIFIADTGHNRIVVADGVTGAVQALYGSGEAGLEDGDAGSARLNGPQGMALTDDGSVLYVADTGNHAVRAVELDTGAVSTFVGSGRIGWPPRSGTVAEVDLNSPWALALRDEVLYIANAGSHQIFAAGLSTGTVRPIVGNATEGTANGPLGDAELAQPSGLAFGDDGRLYFADSESSSIRSADLAGGVTALLAGGDASLFEFGDSDGTGDRARLQHPLGIAWYRGRVLVADTYNSKIKSIEPSTGEVTTLWGGGHGWRDGGDPVFYEPGGLSVRGDVLYVADTNNHVIRIIDLAEGTASTLVLSGIEAFEPEAGDAGYRGEVITLAPFGISSGNVTIVVDAVLPAGYKVNAQAPSSLTLSTGEAIDLTGTPLPRSIAVTLPSDAAELTADLILVYCRADAESLCLIERIRFVVPLTAGTETEIRLPLEVTEPEL